MSETKELFCERCEVDLTPETAVTVEGWVYCASCWERQRESHYSGCICADCAHAELTADND